MMPDKVTGAQGTTQSNYLTLVFPADEGGYGALHSFELRYSGLAASREGVSVMAIATLDKRTFRTTEEIFALVRRFEDCTLPREEWTHAAHLTVALWHLLELDWPEAVAHVRTRIKRYNAAHGILTTPTGGYHETLTLFWLHKVRAFLEAERNEARALVHLANELTATHDKSLPLTHYTRERLFSPEARAGWVEPDLKSLD